jgi:hypothetical protein
MDLLTLGLLALGAVILFVVFSHKPKKEAVVAEAPYKVETPVPAGDVAPQPVVEAPAKAPAKAKAKAPAKAPAKSPTFNESSPNAKAFPKVAAPKSSKADIRKAENAEINQANKKGSTTEQIAASITNSLKAYPSLVGLSGTTPKNYQIEGTQTKTQKAQAAAKAERAKAVAKNKNK